MALVIPDVGEDIALKNLVNHTAPQNLVLRLFTNNVTPGESDTAGTYTEQSGSGYSAITLTGASWSVSGGVASYAQQTFTFTAAASSVYGYYLTQATSGILVAAERFVSGAPFAINNNGDEIKITPTITAG